MVAIEEGAKLNFEITSCNFDSYKFGIANIKISPRGSYGWTNFKISEVIQDSKKYFDEKLAPIFLEDRQNDLTLFNLWIYHLILNSSHYAWAKRNSNKASKCREWKSQKVNLKGMKCTEPQSQYLNKLMSCLIYGRKTPLNKDELTRQMTIYKAADLLAGLLYELRIVNDKNRDEDPKGLSKKVEVEMIRENLVKQYKRYKIGTTPGLPPGYIISTLRKKKRKTPLVKLQP